jgi:peptide deformylase
LRATALPQKIAAYAIRCLCATFRDVVPFDLEDWLAAVPPSPPIVQVGATVLRRRALDVAPSLLATPAFSRLVDIMVGAMRAAPGVGLAAPQIGVPLRVFVAEDHAERTAQQSMYARGLRGRIALPLTVLVNPRVVPSAKDEATFYEGCLSVRGYGALVPRASAVAVTGVGMDGRPVSLRFDGWPARIMQHEMDHLDGTLYVDRMIPRSLAGEEALARLSSMPVSDVLMELVSPHDEH